MRPGSSLLLPAFLLTACLPTLTAIDSGPLSVGSPCEPFDGVDPCNTYGYVCDVDSSGDTSCQYAEFEDPCQPSVGCDPDAGTLTCLQFSYDGGQQALVPLCSTLCDVATDCVENTATCFQDVYLADGGLVSACYTNPCDTAFGPCPITGDGGIGTCIPIDQYGDNACQQSGPIGLDAPCSAVPAIDAGAYLCQQDEACEIWPDGMTTCLAICDYQNGTLACPSDGTECLSGYGLCLTACEPSGPACPSPFSCLELGAGDTAVGDYCTLP